MYSQLPSFVLGFHGCDASVAESIFAGNTQLRTSHNDFDWLGEGVYFWENNPARALEYATQLQNNPRNRGAQIKRVAVVGAVIDLGNCLNLLDTKFLNVVADSYHRLADSMNAAGISLPENRAATAGNGLLLRHLDCAVVNYIHESWAEKGLRPFDTVRSVFIEGDPVYPTAGFYSKNHIQLCVRNSRCIKGYFRPMVEPVAVTGAMF